MNVGSLFTGIGGFDLGLERAGMRVVWQCESNEYRRAVLRKHWPDVPCYKDVRAVGADAEWVDLICGGFPCQDLSLAGKGAGINGARSGLWSEFARIIGDLRPRYVVVENVPALLHRGAGRVLGDLAALGYDAEWDCLPAAAFGAPHRRDRLWIVAYPQSSGREARPTDGLRGFAGGGIPSSTSSRGSYVADRPSNGRGLRRAGRSEPSREGERERALPAVADPEGEPIRPGLRENGQGGQRRGRPSDGGGANGVADARISGLEGHGLEGPASDRTREGNPWSVEPDVGRVVAGFSFELDLIGRVIDDEGNYQEAEPEARELVWKIVRAVWQHRELAEASSELYRRRLHALVPDLSYERARQGWLLGPRLEEDEELCRLWAQVCAEPFAEAQDLLPHLLERARAKKRPQALGTRVDRLAALGDSLVPQIAEWIGDRLMTFDRAIERSKERE